MALFQWDERLATGHPDIDGQHRKIISNINRLQAAIEDNKGKQVTDDLIYFLKAFIDSHFASEEALMADHGLAGLPQHREAHRALRGRVLDLASRYSRGEEDMALEMVAFLDGYFVNHIMTEDLALAQALRTPPAARPPRT